jgi:hypothetical protein
VNYPLVDIQMIAQSPGDFLSLAVNVHKTPAITLMESSGGRRFFVEKAGMPKISKGSSLTPAMSEVAQN